ncbi:MAG: hypothetical protein LBP51_03325 [Deferribacteraceae bacterium]|jgi:general secretion pathway protein C|nr:hypothetical protein [Deferribacteraceae bacterium]
MKILNYSAYLCAALLGLFSAYFAGSAAKYLIVVPPIPNLAGGAPNQDNPAAALDALALAVAERNIFDIEKDIPQPERVSGGGGARSGQPSLDGAGFDGRLTGIIAGTDGSDIRAILLKSNKDVLVLKQGLDIEGYKLESIDAASAVVSYNGAEHTLELQDGLKDSASTPPVSRGAQPFRPSTPATVRSEATENITLDRAEITSQIKDINKVISTLLASPAYVDGSLAGYRIVRMQNESPVRKLGIQPGDIINRINGEELTNPQILFNMLQEVADINAISVDITRNGARKTLFVEVQ